MVETRAALLTSRMTQPEKPPHGSEDQKNEECARSAVSKSAVAGGARPGRRTERLASGSPLPRRDRDVDPAVHRRTAPPDGGDADRAVRRAHLADRLPRRLR